MLWWLDIITYTKQRRERSLGEYECLMMWLCGQSYVPYPWCFVKNIRGYILARIIRYSEKTTLSTPFPHFNNKYLLPLNPLKYSFRHQLRPFGPLPVQTIWQTTGFATRKRGKGQNEELAMRENEEETLIDTWTYYRPVRNRKGNLHRLMSGYTVCMCLKMSVRQCTLFTSRATYTYEQSDLRATLPTSQSDPILHLLLHSSQSDPIPQKRVISDQTVQMGRLIWCYTACVWRLFHLPSLQIIASGHPKHMCSLARFTVCW